MSRLDVKIKDEEKANILVMLEDDKTVEQIAFKYGVTKNCIYWHCKKWKIVINPNKKAGKPRTLLPDTDYSTLPDSILFNPKNYPVF